MIAHQQDAHAWKFVFLGANQDAFAEAQKFGVFPAMAANVTPDAEGFRRASKGSKGVIEFIRKRNYRARRAV